MSCGSVPDGTAEEGEALMPKRQILSRADRKVCSRCRIEPAIYRLRSLVVCNDCFQSSMHHRFLRHIYQPLRPSTSRKNALRPPVQPGQVLIAVSGGAGSMAMLDQIVELGLVGKGDGARADKTKGEKEVVWDSGTMVYVEFAGVTGMGKRSSEMEAVAEDMGLAFVGLQAEDVYDAGLTQRLRNLSGRDATDLAQAASSITSLDHLERLRALLVSLPAASRPSVLQHILTYLLALVSDTLPHVSHLLSGETSTREAQRVISATATGRGWTLALELADKLQLHSSHGSASLVTRLKPMKEISLKEAAIYTHRHRIPTMNERRWVDERSSGGRGKGNTSLEMLTEHFILGLSVTHPATVSTINKTGDKLVFAGDQRSAELCPLCQMPAEPSAQEWKSRTALTALPENPASGRSHPSEASAAHGIDSLLCYACLTTITPHRARQRGDPPDVSVELPIWVGQQASLRRVGEDDMRKGIEDFLL